MGRRDIGSGRSGGHQQQATTRKEHQVAATKRGGGDGVSGAGGQEGVRGNGVSEDEDMRRTRELREGVGQIDGGRGASKAKKSGGGS